MNPTQIRSDAQRCRDTLSEITRSVRYPDELMATIGMAASVEVSARWLIASTVDHARNEGATWEQIGAVLGITRQAAQQRFG